MSLMSLAVCLAALWAGLQNVALYAFLGFVIVPWAGVIMHLAFTDCLTDEEKAVWRSQFWFSSRSLIALWAYMCTTDLNERTRGFRPYRNDVHQLMTQRGMPATAAISSRLT
jgi:hypothetical protein